MDFLTDLFNFLKERKKWWLLPIIFVLLLIGILIVSVVVQPLLRLFIRYFKINE